MYDFYYDKAKKWWGDNVHCLMTDTDSLGLQVFIKDIYADMKVQENEFDFGDYPKSHMLYSDKNKKVIGKIKDESNGEILEEFCGLGPKMYSFYGRKTRKIAAKGVKKSLIKKRIRHSLVRRVLIKQKKN